MMRFFWFRLVAVTSVLLDDLVKLNLLSISFFPYALRDFCIALPLCVEWCISYLMIYIFFVYAVSVCSLII